ncbi:portal protein [Gordonia phage Fryberger]|uniref:Portal protein n=1 Tax=Gordonia phage Fryberger TaxID=2250392 RepID=A0A346FCI9_9CAUD|nr:portal protein [Gordonia phage Fryberger]AXN53453.1 portal protein [Gordonia phage Fryberger]
MDDNTVSDLWQAYMDDLERFDKIYDYVHELRGLPSLPENADAEIRSIRDMCFKNVLILVRDTFVSSLSVVGYSTASSDEQSEGWDLWQQNSMDSRQSEIWTPAITYGASYVTMFVEDDKVIYNPRSPRQMVAGYEDPQADLFPREALEIWHERVGSKWVRRGALWDAENVTPLYMGEATSLSDFGKLGYRADSDGAPVPHGFSIEGGYAPIVRFVNRRDSEDHVMGELEPLLRPQRAINEVNFDRLIVSRWGAFPQKVITGWSGSTAEVRAASARRVWTFSDPEVSASTLDAADVGQYNELLNEMLRHVARTAQISPAVVADAIQNISADALAAAERDQTRKVASMQESFGEAVELMLRESNRALSREVSEDAEVVWRDNETRTLAGTVDAIVKMTTAGVPIEDLLFMMPGMTQQKIQVISAKVKAQKALERQQQMAQLNATRMRSPEAEQATQQGITRENPAQRNTE